MKSSRGSDGLSVSSKPDAASKSGNNAAKERDVLAKQLKIRFEELAVLTSMLEEAAVERATLERALQDEKKRLVPPPQKQSDRHTSASAKISNVDDKLAREMQLRKKLTEENASLLLQLGELSAKIDSQTDEIASLTIMLEESAQRATQITFERRANAESVLGRWLRTLEKSRKRVSPFANKKSSVNDLHLVEGSGLFDGDWYAQQYSNGAWNNTRALRDFMANGWLVGNDPSPRFSVSWYLTKYPDVAASGMNPLVHYLKFGKQEHRMIKDSRFSTR